MKRLTLLGSTGSIGTNTLKIVEKNPELYSVTALVACQNVDKMVEQCQRFQPSYAAMSNEHAAKKVRYILKKLNIKTEVLSGIDAACKLAVLDEVDQVMAAMVGIVGLKPILAAIYAGKTILLANKEALITCGSLFMQAAKKYNARILPVDSEHSAIFQILPHCIQHQLGYLDLRNNGIESILLTGSGGPFRNIPLCELEKISPQQACIHPNWKMGSKISIDSATMMNKGLEYIEARWLFNAKETGQIEIILHPQSIIHSMVRYCDGSVLAQLSYPDMATPIAYSMSWPDRINIPGIKHLDFTKIKELLFFEADYIRYPCLKLAIDACKLGQASVITLNAANEIAVTAFLQYKIRFTDIAAINHEILQSLSYREPNNIEEIIEIDQKARLYVINKLLPTF